MVNSSIDGNYYFDIERASTPHFLCNDLLPGRLDLALHLQINPPQLFAVVKLGDEVFRSVGVGQPLDDSTATDIAENVMLPTPSEIGDIRCRRFRGRRPSCPPAPF